MENGVLGNALEGVHVEEEEGEKTEEESLVENNDNIDGMWSCMWHSRDATCISCVQVAEIGSSYPGSSIRCLGDNLHRVETSVEVAEDNLFLKNSATWLF